jgi:hypothetical protein
MMQCTVAQHSAVQCAIQRSANTAQMCSTTQLSAGVCDRKRLREGGRETFLSPVWFVRFGVCQSSASTHTQCIHAVARCFRAGVLSHFGEVESEHAGGERASCLCFRVLLLLFVESDGHSEASSSVSELDSMSQRLTRRRQSKDMTSRHTIYMKRVR